MHTYNQDDDDSVMIMKTRFMLVVVMRTFTVGMKEMVTVTTRIITTIKQRR